MEKQSPNYPLRRTVGMFLIATLAAVGGYGLGNLSGYTQGQIDLLDELTRQRIERIKKEYPQDELLTVRPVARP